MYRYCISNLKRYNFFRIITIRIPFNSFFYSKLDNRFPLILAINKLNTRKKSISFINCVINKYLKYYFIRFLIN